MGQLQIAAPVKGRGQLLNFIQAHFMVEVFGIAPLHDIHRGLRQCGFHLEYDGCIGLCLLRWRAGEFEHAANVDDVFVPDLDRLSIILQVEFPAKKRHSALIKLCDHVGRIVKVRLRAKTEQSRKRPWVSGIPGAGY